MTSKSRQQALQELFKAIFLTFDESFPDLVNLTIANYCQIWNLQMKCLLISKICEVLHNIYNPLCKFAAIMRVLKK